MVTSLCCLTITSAFPRSDSAIDSVLTIVNGKVVYGAEEFAPFSPPLPPASPDWAPPSTLLGRCRPAPCLIGARAADGTTQSGAARIMIRALLGSDGMRLLGILIAVLMMSPASSAAQSAEKPSGDPAAPSQWSFGGEVRVQYERFANEEWGAAPDDDNGYLLQRYIFASSAASMRTSLIGRK